MTSGEILGRLRERFGVEGLRIVLPVARVGLEAVGVDRVVPFAKGAVLVGDGGGELFARFSAASWAEEEDHPLDAYTRRGVMRVVEEVLRGTAFEVFFPFATERVHLPFQRIGGRRGWRRRGRWGCKCIRGSGRGGRIGRWWCWAFRWRQSRGWRSRVRGVRDLA